MRRVSYSYFACSISFSALRRASGPVFMFCAPGLIFGGAERVESPLHILRAQNRFRWYRGPRVPFSCFARPDSFSAVLNASGLIFIFCPPGLVFGSTVGVGSRFHVLGSRTHIQRSREHQVLFSCFARSDSFSTVPRASGLVFMFCVAELVFDGTEGVGTLFLVLRSRTPF
jgi:hypothetical protein